MKRGGSTGLDPLGERDWRGLYFSESALGSSAVLSIGNIAYVIFTGWPDAAEAMAVTLIYLPLALFAIGLWFQREETSLTIFRATTAVCWVPFAFLTGGIESFIIYPVILIPLATAMCRETPEIILSTVLLVVALAFLFVMDAIDALPVSSIPPDVQAALNLCGIVMAMLRGATLGFMHVRIRRAQQEKQRWETIRLALIADGTSDVIAYHNVAARQIAYVSPSVASILGYTPEEFILLQRQIDIVMPDDRPKVAASFSAAAGPDRTGRCQFRVRHKDGRIVWLEGVSTGLATGEDEQVREIVSIFRDVTAQKEHERTLSRAKEEAETANRMKSRFLANMSHELRTPLNAIIGFSDLTRQETFGPVGNHRYREYSQAIFESGNHLLELINDVLDMSKIEAGAYELTPRAIDPGQLIEECLRVVEVSATKKRLHVIRQFEHDVATEFCADQRALRQILINLLTNAVKFTPSDGRITVTTHTDGSSESPWLVISVEDNGVGIAADILPQLGRPFVQAARHTPEATADEGGTGLGLSICKALTELHGGVLDLVSDVKTGTQVTVRLPYALPVTRHHPGRRRDAA